jgi:hypothetical protein
MDGRVALTPPPPHLFFFPLPPSPSPSIPFAHSVCRVLHIPRLCFCPASRVSLSLSPHPPAPPASLRASLRASRAMPGNLAVLTAVDKLRPKLGDAARHPPPASLPRPFFTHQVPPLLEPVDKLIEFPADEVKKIFLRA